MNATTVAGWPHFPDGDTVIVISSTKTYRLHSTVLRRSSPYFRHELDRFPAARLTAAARRENAAPIRFELKKTIQGPIGRLERKQISESGRTSQRGHILQDLDSGRMGNDQNRYWDWLFGCFYNRQPDFDDHNLATILNGCMGLVDVAESIDAVDQVRPYVDLALMRQDMTLWTSIATNPVAWAELGRRVHSPQIFYEAVIHVVGKWQTMQEQEKNQLHHDIRRVCEKKWKEIDLAKEAIDMRILGHYPTFLSRSHENRPHRPTYANDIYMWMAICFFRQWFAQCISDGRNRTNPDGGYEFYNTLAKAGQAYLDHGTFQDFHRYFPMSSKACNVLETNMNILKEDVKQFVRDIVRERAHVKKADFPELAWLTCAVVKREDLPWTQSDEILDEVPMASFDNMADDNDTEHAQVDPQSLPPLPVRTSAFARDGPFYHSPSSSGGSGSGSGDVHERDAGPHTDEG